MEGQCSDIAGPMQRKCSANAMQTQLQCSPNAALIQCLQSLIFGIKTEKIGKCGNNGSRGSNGKKRRKLTSRNAFGYARHLKNTPILLYGCPLKGAVHFVRSRLTPKRNGLKNVLAICRLYVPTHSTAKHNFIRICRQKGGRASKAPPAMFGKLKEFKSFICTNLTCYLLY